MRSGCDSFYTNNSSDLIKDLRKENVPVVSHVGLVPGNRNWTGGFRAIGKTADEALGVVRHAMELDDAGAIGLEVEVIPPKVAEIVTKKLVTISEFLSPINFPKKPDIIEAIKGSAIIEISILTF